MLWLIIWGIVFAALFYYYAVRPMSYWKKRGVKQGNPAWLFGDNINIVLQKESFADTVVRLYNQFPNERYSGVYQVTVPTLMLTDPELIKKVAVKDFEHFVDHRPIIPENADPLWTKNLFALRGQRWKDMRPILSPSFTSSKMKNMFILMTEVAQSFIEYYKKDVNKGSDDVIELEMKDSLTRYGNDIIASVAFGFKVDSLREKENEFFLMGKEATDFGGILKTLKFLGYSLVPKLYDLLNISLFSKKVSKFFLSLVDDTIRLREEQGIVRHDMIHLLLEARRGEDKNEENTNVETGFATVQEAEIPKANAFNKRDITNLDIAAQALIFFFAGFESVTTMMTFMAYELALNPDIQKKLRDEVEDTCQDCNGKLTYEALMKMKYMDMVVSETLRKWPNAVATDRICNKPYTIEPVNPDEKPFVIEKDEVIWIPVFGLHRDPKYWPEPERFDPERFNDENKHKINPYAYLPFGIGPRNCIGSRFALLECKTLFYYLLLNFEIVPVKKTRIPLRLAKAALNVKAEGGHWLGLKPLRTH